MMKKPSFMSFSQGASVVRGAGVKVIRGMDAVNSVELQEDLDSIGVSTPVYRFIVNGGSRYIYHASFVT